MIQPHHLFHFQWIYQYLTCLLLEGVLAGVAFRYPKTTRNSSGFSCMAYTPILYPWDFWDDLQPHRYDAFPSKLRYWLHHCI